MATPDPRRLSTLEFLVLAVLGEGSLHAYGLVHAIRERTDGRVRVRPGNLYRLLDRLRGHGLLEELDGVREPARGGERTRFFAVTASGRRVAQEEAQLFVDVIERSPSLAATSASRGR